MTKYTSFITLRLPTLATKKLIPYLMELGLKRAEISMLKLSQNSSFPILQMFRRLRQRNIDCLKSAYGDGQRVRENPG